MLSTVIAAQLQFRHDTAARDRDRNLLFAIDERRAAVAASAVRTVPVRRRPGTWPRPIAPQQACAA